MAQERYCARCGKHVRCRQARHAIPETTRSMLKLFCPACGRELGAVYDEELQITRTFPAPRG